MYLDISSMRKPSMGGRKHWVMWMKQQSTRRVSVEKEE